MKKLYFIIAIFAALSTTQNIYAIQTAPNTGAEKRDGTWYSIIVDDQYDIQDGNNLDVSFSYPSDYLWFDCYRKNWTGIANNKKIEVQHDATGSMTVLHTFTINDNDRWYEDLGLGLNTNARKIAFRRVAGSASRYIKDVKVRMATHTKMNTSSISFLNVPVGTTQTQTIDFYSFLTGENGMEISIVDGNNKPATVTGLSLSRTSINKNECEKIGENNFSITVTFNPQSIFSLKDYKIKIQNTGAVDNPTIYILISDLSSALHAPTLSVTTNAYEFVTLSWNKIEGATSYKIYDNGTLVGTYTNTTATITGLSMGSSHKYTVRSIYGSSNSNPSNEIPLTTPTYPKVSSVTFSNVQQNQFTINWNKVAITYPGHEFIRYQIYIYRTNKGGALEYDQTISVTDNNKTSYTVTGVDDATTFRVSIGVCFKYTVNGNTKTYNTQDVVQNVQNYVTTPDFIGSGSFDGVQIYKGEWHRIEAGISHKMGVGEGCEISLRNYPCENLKYKAWVNGDVSGEHYISEDATNIEYLLGCNNCTTYLEGNKFQTPIMSIKPEYTNIKFKSRREWGLTAIYVSDMYAKIAPHIKIKSNAYINAQYPYIPFGRIRLNGESVTATINFQSFLVFNELKVTSTNPKFKLSKSVIAPATTSKAGTFCQQGETKYDFTITFTPDELGSHNSRITITDGVNSIAFTVDATVYSKNRLHVAGDWNNSSNWFFGVPAPTEDVEIAAAVTIPNGYTAIANDVSIESGGSISIAPQGALKVNTILGANANNLSLQANENGSATLLFKNTDKVNASIQLYSIASSDGLRDSIAGNFKDPKWQYLGIIAESAQYSALNPDGTTNWMYRWDETKNSTSCWAEKLKSGSTLSAWIGYGIAQEQATLYNYSGTLINSDYTYNLTFTSNDGYTEDRGYNLITNSYSAPIDIATINTTNFVNAVENIYIYNTGSYAEWRDNNNPLGFGPGQMISIPVNSISALGNEYPHTIPSGQAFFVKANNNSATFTVNYNSNVYNATNTATQKRAPKADSNEFNVLKIQVTSSTSNDRLYLLEHENCTPNFDNGYDAEKIFDNPNGPQIYASNTFGYTSINTDTTFNGQTIGFIANSESEIYTMTFDIEKLHSYDEIYLYDSQTGIYTNILEEELYQFYGDTKQTDNRFSIIAKRNESPKSDITTSTEIITLEELFAQNKTIYLYTTTGQLVNIIEPNCQIDKTLPTGIYIVKCGDKILKVKF